MSIIQRMKEYRFELQHLIILFAILILFQTILSYVNSTSASNLLNRTMDVYRQDTAERVADLTTTSLELILEQGMSQVSHTSQDKQNLIRALNIILSQQSLQRNVSDICILLESPTGAMAVDDGSDLYEIFIENRTPHAPDTDEHFTAVQWHGEAVSALHQNEQIQSFLEGEHQFHVLVPFFPRGELVGAVYMSIIPDFRNIEQVIASSYNQTGALFTALILLGLLGMFLMTSYMVKERDVAQKKLFEKREEEIKHQKEALFTRRIYHTHHKAEKVMGFIIEDLHQTHVEKIRKRIRKYAQFVSRVIYDMKSYDPPLHTIRNPIFRTDLNEVISFLADNIFKRVARPSDLFQFQLELDDKVPEIQVNEYVVWEIIEPLIQNSIDHNRYEDILITLRTDYYPESQTTRVIISDDGTGLNDDLLQTNNEGRQVVFLEHSSTKSDNENTGYGCYIAYEMAKRCGWILQAQNNDAGGADFVLTINHNRG